ncbi:MAG: Methyltransferase type 11 [uncultured Sphingomonas sp.]|uniref:Methyltransferase type 11 n=1 Tax=uncultured Sphingomonas sp. TaxID=158754 RepID=A0A6J4SM51_9SPHN|nr:TIGR04290 family methyltransferase [uncultured Sphingomonas sp.]CAA9502444.1 MAG: Methyltransferase type 11 [uncultured Sphingomonas sp.]
MLAASQASDRGAVEQRVKELAPWFHDLDLKGVRTAPDHFLFDYPAGKFRRFASVVPEDLSGKSVLDIGCNAGFYSFDMKRRGASRVLGIDHDERYLEQARFAAEVLGFDDVEFRQGEVWDVGALGERFDLVIFMGVLYHLRHPLLALDLIREHVAGDLLLFQSLTAGSTEHAQPEPDYEFFEGVKAIEGEGWPLMHFVEHRLAGDPTNWWVPNSAACAAMLRSAGFNLVAQPISDVFLAQVSPEPVSHGGAVYPAKGPAA